MKSLTPLLAIAVGTVAGAAAFALLARDQVGPEVEGVGARLGIRPSKGGGGLEVATKLLEAVAPGASERLTTALAVTALGGALAAVVAYAATRELVG